MEHILNWNVTGLLQYGQDEAKIKAAEGDFNHVVSRYFSLLHGTLHATVVGRLT